MNKEQNKELANLLVKKSVATWYGGFLKIQTLRNIYIIDPLCIYDFITEKISQIAESDSLFWDYLIHWIDNESPLKINVLSL